MGEGLPVAPIQTSVAPGGAGPGHRLVFSSGRRKLEPMGGAVLSLSTQLVGCLPAGLHTGRGQGFPWEELRLSGSLGCLHFLDASIFNLAQFLINCLCGEQ